MRFLLGALLQHCLQAFISTQDNKSLGCELRSINLLKPKAIFKKILKNLEIGFLNQCKFTKVGLFHFIFHLSFKEQTFGVLKQNDVRGALDKRCLLILPMLKSFYWHGIFSLERSQQRRGKMQRGEHWVFCKLSSLYGSCRPFKVWKTQPRLQHTHKFKPSKFRHQDPVVSSLSKYARKSREQLQTHISPSARNSLKCHPWW